MVSSGWKADRWKLCKIFNDIVKEHSHVSNHHRRPTKGVSSLFWMQCPDQWSPAFVRNSKFDRCSRWRTRLVSGALPTSQHPFGDTKRNAVSKRYNVTQDTEQKRSEFRSASAATQTEEPTHVPCEFCSAFVLLIGVSRRACAGRFQKCFIVGPLLTEQIRQANRTGATTRISQNWRYLAHSH